MLDKFFEQPIMPISNWEGSNLASPSFLEFFQYNYQQPGLEDFAGWLRSFLSTDEFTQAASRFIELSKALNHEDDTEKRSYLVEQISLLEKGNTFIT
ncbi:hypothetical protein [Dyadobacter psychrophilus]|uniref:Uncharacterized protein n=1 Tax=Dyadobacter psychrophilus TaxID=651661 RepID=A0A1T5HEI1_9BACT|nr:hypothetical protein [Dyadobacter psychrophilus]SKC19088.1 hypothetical protein SAMN05660293_05424 [Dyadobacter psychrophilus]